MAVHGIDSEKVNSVDQMKLRNKILFETPLNILTICSSSGTRDRKSSSSLFGIVFGRRMRRENFIIPQKSSRKRMGMKCKTTIPPTSRATASHVSSGTEKLKVLDHAAMQINLENAITVKAGEQKIS